MDIIPLNNKKTAASTPAEKRLENPDTNENAKPSQHVYPVTVPDEATGAKYFAKELSKNSKANVAIKVVESQTMHLLSSAPKSLLLSKQGREKSRENAHCEKCRENAFDNLAEVQLHFKTLHQLNVNIKVAFVKY